MNTFNTYETQDLMQYGFTDFMGDTWPDQWVDTYNQFTAQINKSAGYPVANDSLTQKERDFYLDQRHKTFAQYMQILSEAS